MYRDRLAGMPEMRSLLEGQPKEKASAVDVMLSFQMATYKLVEKLAENHKINVTAALDEMVKEGNETKADDKDKNKGKDAMTYQFRYTSS